MNPTSLPWLLLRYAFVLLLVLVVRCAVVLMRVDRLTLLCSGTPAGPKGWFLFRFSTPSTIKAAVWRVGCPILGENCLTLAIAETFLLRLNGWNARVVVGIGLREGKLRAHAWACMDDPSEIAEAGYLPVELAAAVS